MEKLDKLHIAALACAAFGLMYIMDFNFQTLILISGAVVGVMLFRRFFQRR